MNSKTINKLNFFLSGLTARYQDNSDLFQGLDLTFKSGKKTLKGQVKLNQDTLNYAFAGSRKTGDLAKILDHILEDAAPYDALEITYKERGYRMIIQADDKDIRVKNEELAKEPPTATTASPLLNRQYLLNPDEASDLLKALDILSPDGKIKNDRIRKFSQIDHYIEILLPDLERFKQYKRPIHIVDCGCGKSYLSFALNYYLAEVMKVKSHFTGIDISPGVIQSSQALADQLDYRNMRFIQGDIRNLDVSKADIVMSLHACDTATDLALNFGIGQKAELIIAVPCCHAEMNSRYSYEPFAGILKHKILKRRMADVLTDGIRCLLLEQYGYDTTIMEYISPLDTPKNLLIKARRTGKINPKAEDDMLKLILDLDYAPALYRYLHDLDDGSEALPDHQEDF